ncbi:hypothetical protein NEOLEDRAFT_1130997 [Neolentinus lepideus HHB14362 ss-1]|uniref:Glutathione S-transferase UstS-like C-terminal domain-containing protein n=1 Tax=Neolentinus lepideus HHB14362 ss-1 TaxID=1314782 RepID=A0A165U037_9AGAM|nr:hypothetical protein NEOLEDRAFT_1130997 [Neolentinus lepideus HHB14362 ss-1]
MPCLAQFASTVTIWEQSGPSQLYLMGDVPVWADVVGVAFATCVRRVFGDKSEEWRRFSNWRGGRWTRLADVLVSRIKTS